jgi:hypothetical protein
MGMRRQTNTKKSGQRARGNTRSAQAQALLQPGAIPVGNVRCCPGQQLAGLVLGSKHQVPSEPQPKLVVQSLRAVRHNVMRKT